MYGTVTSEHGENSTNQTNEEGYALRRVATTVLEDGKDIMSRSLCGSHL